MADIIYFAEYAGRAKARLCQKKGLEKELGTMAADKMIDTILDMFLTLWQAAEIFSITLGSLKQEKINVSEDLLAENIKMDEILSRSQKQICDEYNEGTEEAILAIVEYKKALSKNQLSINDRFDILQYLRACYTKAA